MAGSPTIAEIAALAARLRELTAAVCTADPADRAAFLADKDALLARIAESDTDAEDLAGLTGGEGPILDSGPTLSAEDAAHVLAQDGRSLAAARELVQRYQDEATEHLGISVHAWGLDDADLDTIRAAATPAPGPPPAVRPGSGRDGDEDTRMGQLAQWHVEAATADGGDVETLDRTERS